MREEGLLFGGGGSPLQVGGMRGDMSAGVLAGTLAHCGTGVPQAPDPCSLPVEMRQWQRWRAKGGEAAALALQP